MRFRTLPTRIRLTAINAAVFGVAAAIAATACWLVFAHQEYDAVDATLAAQAQTVLAGIEDRNGTITLGSTSKLPGETSQGIAVAVALLGPRSQVIDSNGQLMGAQLASVAAPTATSEFRSSTLQGNPYRLFLRKVSLDNGSTGFILLARPVAEVKTALLQVGALLAVAVAGLISIGAALVYWMTGRALHPVRVMSQTARDISEHDLHRRIELDLPRDELGELATTLNAMLGRLDTGFQAMARFTGDAAHELRTPVAFIRNEAEVTLRRPRSAQEYQASVEAILAEAEGLSRTADRLLVLARADAGALGAGFGAVELPSLIEETTERWRTQTQRKGVRLAVSVPEQAPAEGDEDLLKRLVDNLVENAVRYTPAGGAIAVALTAAPPWWELRVTDTGPGVDSVRASTLFQRFTKGDQARGRAGGGTGLGLALAAAVVAAHGGSIALETRSPDGASFRVRLPMPSDVRLSPGASRPGPA